MRTPHCGGVRGANLRFKLRAFCGRHAPADQRCTGSRHWSSSDAPYSLEHPGQHGRRACDRDEYRGCEPKLSHRITRSRAGVEPAEPDLELEHVCTVGRDHALAHRDDTAAELSVAAAGRAGHLDSQLDFEHGTAERSAVAQGNCDAACIGTATGQRKRACTVHCSATRIGARSSRRPA